MLPRMRVRAPALLLALFSALILSANADAADLKFPALTGRVVDEANLLSDSTEARLTGWLAGLEAAKRYQVVVVTLPSLQDTSIEDFGYRLGRHWGIGEAGKNTGALLVVAPNQRAVRIEAGYGLEGTLTDALSRQIIERDLLPAFRAGNFEQGVVAGTAAILRTLGFKPSDAPVPGRSSAAPDEGSVFGLIVPVLAILVFFFMRRRGGGGGFGGLTSGPIVPWRGGSGRRSSGFGSFGGGSRGSSGGGFKGGGGSFGGGGASGRW